MLNKFSYGIVEGNENHVNAILEDTEGKVVARIDIPDIKALGQVVSEKEVYEVLREVYKRFDNLYESCKLPESLYRLNVSKECWDEIVENVLKKAGKF